jgi:hypothetical protein
VKFERSNESVTIICDAEALPPPSFEILFNGTELTRNKTFYISEMNESRVGFYKCVASNIIGKKSSLPKYLPYKGKIIFSVYIFKKFINNSRGKYKRNECLINVCKSDKDLS